MAPTKSQSEKQMVSNSDPFQAVDSPVTKAANDNRKPQNNSILKGMILGFIGITALIWLIS